MMGDDILDDGAPDDDEAPEGEADGTDAPVDEPGAEPEPEPAPAYPILHEVRSVGATAEPAVYVLSVDITDMHGERYDCDYCSRPSDTFGLAPAVRAALDQWLADGGPVAPYAPPAAGAADVDAERDRRIADTFVFGGAAFQCDAASQQNIIAKGALAKFAVLAGAQAGDLRWNNAGMDFGWIATDNSVVPMDAPTMAAFADAADLWVTAHIMAARMLKDADPIPADYATNGSYWP